jgi:hypothetical protein
MRTGAVPRTLMATLALLLLLLAAPAAQAAPTCQSRTGLAMKCGTPGAMPVGWEPPQTLEMDPSHPPDVDSHEMWKAICLVTLFLVLTALLPKFDGSRGGDWDKQEDDDRHG